MRDSLQLGSVDDNERFIAKGRHVLSCNMRRLNRTSALRAIAAAQVNGQQQRALEK